MFQVGDKVICVDDIFENTDKRKGSIMEGRIYIIRAIGIEMWYPENTLVLLEGIYCPPTSNLANEAGFEIQRFRKLEPPKEEITESENELAVSQ